MVMMMMMMMTIIIFSGGKAGFFFIQDVLCGKVNIPLFTKLSDEVCSKNLIRIAKIILINTNTNQY
jgi:hypothetical protein